MKKTRFMKKMRKMDGEMDRMLLSMRMMRQDMQKMRIWNQPVTPEDMMRYPDFPMEHHQRMLGRRRLVQKLKQCLKRIPGQIRKRF